MDISLSNKNFDKCCRTCLNDGAEKMYDIFENYADTVNIAEILATYTSIQVTMEDQLPKKLCSNCYQCLLSFHYFKNTALEVDENLNNYLKNEDQPNNIEQDNIKEILCPSEHTIKMENDDENIQYKYLIEDDDMGNNTSNVSEETDCIEKPSKIQNIKLRCEICNKKFKNQSIYEHHVLTHNIETLKDCHSYIQHIVKHKQDIKQDTVAPEYKFNVKESYVCEICSFSFQSIPSLSAHKRAHTSKDRVLKCTICGKIFKKISHLKRHELTHNDKRPFKCTLCSKTYPTEEYLMAHMNKHNGIKNHPCPICTKKFAHLRSLTNHIKLHTREKPYLCPTCGKIFVSSTNLAQHMKRHDGVKLFACNLCPRKFISKGELKTHGITHSNERSFPCDQCNGAFSKHSYLLKHKRNTHLGVKPYQCDVCAMKFADKYHLKRHYRVHTGEKPYRCDNCDRAFTQSNDLVKHKRTHLGNNLYKCNECSQSFRLKTELREHISEHFISEQLKSKAAVNTAQSLTTQDNSNLERGLLRTNSSQIYITFA